MRRITLGALALALTALATGIGAAAAAHPSTPRLVAAPSAAAPVPAAVVRATRVDPPAPEDPRRQIELRVVELVNIERAKAGVAPVAWDERIGTAARAHSDDQAAWQTMSHTGSDGSTLATRIGRVGFAWRALAENVAAGQPTAENVVSAWMNSPGHRTNILNAQYTVAGAGLGISITNTNYWTLDLGTPG